MLSMQEFRQWLSSTEEKSEAYQQNLHQLTKTSLQDLLEVRKSTGDLGWTIWNASPAKTAS